jgi:molecular chaperone DnaK
VDANGILNVSAKDKATGKSQSIRITGSSGLSKDEIEKMRKEAQDSAEIDKKERALVEKINAADSLIFGTEKFIRELGTKVTDEKKSELEKLFVNLRAACTSKNESEIDLLCKQITDISAQLYQAQANDINNSNTPPTSSDSTKSSANDNIQDATFEEVKDEK